MSRCTLTVSILVGPSSSRPTFDTLGSSTPISAPLTSLFQISAVHIWMVPISATLISLLPRFGAPIFVTRSYSERTFREQNLSQPTYILVLTE